MDNRTLILGAIVAGVVVYGLTKQRSRSLSPSLRGIIYEKKVTARLGAKHVGGPGKPDFVKGSMIGEVKNWRRRVDSGAVWRAHDKGVNVIVSRSGFTDPAIDLAEGLGIRLRGWS